MKIIPGTTKSKAPPRTIKNTSIEDQISGQIRWFELEKDSFQPSAWLFNKANIPLASAIEDQMLSTKTAAKINRVIILLAIKDPGKNASKYKKVVPKADSTKLGTKRIIIYGIKVRQLFLYKCQLSLTISIEVFNIKI
jgi:hypothetical protein